MAAFANIHALQLPKLTPLTVYCLAIRIRTDRRVLAATLLSCRREYDRAVREHGTLICLYDKNLGNTDGFDTKPYVSSCEWTVLLAKLIPSPRKRDALLHDIDAISPDIPKYQREVTECIVRHVYPFSWVQFLRRRVALTYKITVAGVLEDEQVERILLFVRGTRPVLKVCWLRFCLNSIPTSCRLHDDGCSYCPVCGNSSDHIAHVVQCQNLFHIALSVLTSRYKRNLTGSLRDGGSPFASGLGVMDLPLSFNNETTPISFREHVLRVLGFRSSSQADFKLVVELLYVVQYVFIACRRHSSADNSHLGNRPSNEFMVNTAHAAVSTLA